MSKETKAVAALGSKPSESYYSRSVRKIDNGYIVSEYEDGKSSEKFVQSVEMGTSPRGTGPNEHKGSLAEAAAWLKGK